MDHITVNARVIENIRTSTRVSLSQALEHSGTIWRHVDDQIQASWHNRRSVSADRYSGTRRRGQYRNETMASPGRSPPAARRRYSNISFCIPEAP
jgi:hypothetical protein